MSRAFLFAVALARQDTCPSDTVQLELCLGVGREPEETPTPAPTWIVPPSPTPRVTRSVETPVGSSNLDYIMKQGTLVIGWVGPALFGILFAAFAWATGVFNWLWSLATWLLSGEWRGEG